jgi:hypothetical protein
MLPQFLQAYRRRACFSRSGLKEIARILDEEVTFAFNRRVVIGVGAGGTIVVVQKFKPHEFQEYILFCVCQVRMVAVCFFIPASGVDNVDLSLNHRFRIILFGFGLDSFVFL